MVPLWYSMEMNGNSKGFSGDSMRLCCDSIGFRVMILDLMMISLGISWEYHGNIMGISWEYRYNLSGNCGINDSLSGSFKQMLLNMGPKRTIYLAKS